MASGRSVRAVRHIAPSPVGQLLEAFNDTMNISFLQDQKHALRMR